MPLIPFPDVPNLPGVPALPRSPNFPPAIAVGLGLLQGILWQTTQTQTKWGIFNSAGESIADSLSFTDFGATLSTNAFDFSKETKVSDFPIERGSFASYNKVETPAAPVVTMCLTGSESDRRAFLEAIDAATKSTDLYSVVTPEVTYVEYSIERYNYSRRSDRGASLLIVEISLKEIRQVSSQYTQSTANGQIDQPQNVGATPVADNGKVQATTPSSSVLNSIGSSLGISQ